jgi:hypothetical protein
MGKQKYVLHNNGLWIGDITYKYCLFSYVLYCTTKSRKAAQVSIIGKSSNQGTKQLLFYFCGLIV